AEHLRELVEDAAARVARVGLHRIGKPDDCEDRLLRLRLANLVRRHAPLRDELVQLARALCRRQLLKLLRLGVLASDERSERAAVPIAREPEALRVELAFRHGERERRARTAPVAVVLLVVVT